MVLISNTFFWNIYIKYDLSLTGRGLMSATEDIRQFDDLVLVSNKTSNSIASSDECLDLSRSKSNSTSCTKDNLAAQHKTPNKDKNKANQVHTSKMPNIKVFSGN